MARLPSITLTDAELRLMRVLWKQQEATVSEVVQNLQSDGNEPAYTTVLTILRILEKKGYVTHTKEGRAFRYKPVVKQAEARRRALRHLLARFFNNSPELLLLNILEDEKLTLHDIQRLKKQVDAF